MSVLHTSPINKVLQSCEREHLGRW